jgi:hypothetical protein
MGLAFPDALADAPPSSMGMRMLWRPAFHDPSPPVPGAYQEVLATP